MHLLMLKLRVMVYCIICGQRIYQKAFFFSIDCVKIYFSQSIVNYFSQYFFNIFECVGLLHTAYIIDFNFSSINFLIKIFFLAKLYTYIIWQYCLSVKI